MQDTAKHAPGPLTDEAFRRLQAWEGRSESRSDVITAAPVSGLTAMLDRDDEDSQTGAALPALWHWLYFLPRDKQEALGPDGHARRGGFLPPVPLPKRMWAGGRFEWHKPLRVGDTASRLSTIRSIQHKRGRAGDLVFVTVRHEISGAQGLCLTEEHDIVYRDEPPPGDPVPMPVPAPSPADEAWRRTITPDAVLLFRYSALTFNGHRIHYDREYVTQVEGYPGLVVHGPLIATLLVDLVRREQAGRQLAKFEFRAVRPSFDGSPLHICGAPHADGALALWAAGDDGSLRMQARAEFR
jgi:3-methylfumaryl-CoA hydratase